MSLLNKRLYLQHYIDPGGGAGTWTTDHLNSVNDDIKWTTEGEVELRAQPEVSTRVGEEETSVRVERDIGILGYLDGG